MPVNQQQRDFLKSSFGMSDAELHSISDNIVKILAKFEVLAQYEIEAEAIDSSYCSVGIKRGDKFVFSAMPIVIKSDKSSAGLCMRALSMLGPALNTIADRIAEGVDPNAGIWRFSECSDTGIGHGGFGKVRFKFTAHKVQ